MVTIPRQIAAYSDLAAEFQRVLADALALANDQDGLTLADVRTIAVTSSGVFVQVVSGYSSLSGEQKKALVDAALVELIRALKPHIIDSAKALVAVALPWYLRWLPYVIGWLIQLDAVDQLINEIPDISQASYNAWKFFWTKIKKG